MPDPSPIDPLAVMQSLIAAWNRGQSNDAPSGQTPHVASTQSDFAERLARIESSLLRIEAQMAVLAAEGGTGRKKRAKRD